MASPTEKSMLACFITFALCGTAVYAQLSPTFYDATCPAAFSIIKGAVRQAVDREARMAASLLRVHFHDCFVNGCDGSVLLDDNSTFTGEKTAGANNNSLRGFDVIDTIKSEVEANCNGVVSCADILAIVARDVVFAVGGPSWTVLLGRRDSTTASLSAANSNLLPPFFNLSQLISGFQAQGLTTHDLIALYGAHTIGQAQCFTFRDHIYNESDIDRAFAASLQANCPRTSGTGDSNLSFLDVETPTAFDNSFYKLLMVQKGLLHSDQEFFNGGSADSQVSTYANSQTAFFTDFAASMVNMGNIKPLTGAEGEIRINCRKSNC